MMQPQLFQQPSWPFYNIMHSPRDHVGAYGGLQMNGQFLSTIFSNEFLEDPMSGDELQSPTPVETIADDMEGIDIISCGEFEDVCRWLGEDACEGSLSSEQLSIEGEDVWSPCPSTKSSEASMVFPSAQVSPSLPRDGNEIETQLTIQHLLKAYGEAMEMEQRELAEVIVKCIVEKVSPVGETLERLTLNLFQSEGKQGDYLKQESIKNFEAAFNAFYQIFPYGRFAHFTANSAVLEAMPENVETVHIIDFDMMEGVQWPPMIEAVAQRQKALRLTSIKVEDCGDAPLYWRFEETKRRLCNHARSFGLNLKVDEVGIEDLVTAMGKIKKRGGRREWLVFNCMVGLPHMGRERSRSHVKEFLGVAKALLDDSATNKGIITIGDGDAAERLKSCTTYGSFFDKNLYRFQALCESMEWNFPVCLAEARLAMENLFVAPSISSLSWRRKWEEMREGSDLHAEIGLEGLRLTEENLTEAKEMMAEGKSLFTVRIEAQKQNEMVLEWRGTSLVRVSTWR
ncbi:Nodulation-signaling pathway 2 protein [Actinidia chinensis var. chinensis]|uniref:Nodulation-signaling pathway 2 protein n=1 Tax=Actinidia chinensis var. chinensis TaxID=1590841 RepID=A0A2R6RRR1_ACTCC|nr:Nodulation-signaling pathway 2 protein [Actinidia chinensis var. chinensis]